MDNKRYIYQVGGHFRFIKLFEQLSTAIYWVKERSYPTNWQEPCAYHAWGGSDVLSDVQHDLERKTKANRIKNSKMLFRAVCEPMFEANAKAMSNVNKTVETIDPAEFEVNSGFGSEVHCEWNAKIEVCLQYTELLDEVKIAGEPYQPAREQECTTEWFPVYKMAGRNQYEWRLSIDPTPRSLNPRGYNTSVVMEPTAYWHRMSGNTIVLTTTED